MADEPPATEECPVYRMINRLRRLFIVAVLLSE